MSQAAAQKQDPSLLRMSGPLMVSFIMRSAFTFVDTVYAAYEGDAAVAAIGLTFPFEFVMIAFWVGLSTGLTSTISRAMGAHQGRKIEQYLKATWRLVWIVSPLFLLIGAAIWFAAPRQGLDTDVYRSFRIYGSVLIAGSALTTFWSVIPDSVVKAHQDTRSTMWAGIWSNVTNLALNTLFLFVFGWGIFGIALSTVIGRLAGLVYALRKAAQHEARRLQEGLDVDLTPDPAPYKPILALAVPASITFMLMAAETAVVNLMLAGEPDGTSAIAAYSIYYRIMMTAAMPMIAMSVAMLPFAAKRIGRNDAPGLYRGLREAGVVSVAYAVGIMVPVVWLWGDALASWLSEAPLTAEYTAFGLQMVPIASLALAPFILCRPVFEAMGRGKPGLYMAILRYVVLTLPAAYLGMRVARAYGQPNLYGILIGLVVVAVISSLLFSAWLRRALPSAVSAVGA
jgi:putative MATE family efflux protein